MATLKATLPSIISVDASLQFTPTVDESAQLPQFGKFIVNGNQLGSCKIAKNRAIQFIVDRGKNAGLCFELSTAELCDIFIKLYECDLRAPVKVEMVAPNNSIL